MIILIKLKIKMITNKIKPFLFYNTIIKSFASKKNIRFAVLLSGCGVYDGRYKTK